MSPEDLRALLDRVSRGQVSVPDAVHALAELPFQDLGYATVDHHRALRTGVPEVVFGLGKTAEQIAGIVRAIAERGQTAMVTRVDAAKGAAALALLPAELRARTRYEPLPLLLVSGDPLPRRGRGTICVVTAGTSDAWVAEEAARTAELLGNEVVRIQDVGVAGLHRLLAHRTRIESAQVAIVVAGMEGALPSVVAGLISRPVIAVPTSVGVGASFHGLAALLAMLNSCAPGITVVNIDGGFNAGFAASLINSDPAPARAGASP